MNASTIFQPGKLRGRISVPGDKSISHRALIITASTSQSVEIRNLNPGADVRATANALRALGADVQIDSNLARVRGGELHDANATLDCANSGSTARMMMGVCAGANVHAVFDGDLSLRKRPMEPVAAQLRAFGARIETTDGKLPATVQGTADPETHNFILLSPSAQIKSALLFAGLFGNVPITITGDKGSRDHTERLLQYLGADLTFDRERIELKEGPKQFSSLEIAGDFSAAAFFIVAATITPGSEIEIMGVGVNPSRTGLLDALQSMGARIELRNQRELCGEPIADILVRSAWLHGTRVSGTMALRGIDEIVVLAVAAAFAQGETRISGVRELRAKESDRLAAIARLMDVVDTPIETTTDGVLISGGKPQLNGSAIATEGDHRTAMAAAVLAAATGPVAIDESQSIAVSFPEFTRTLRAAQTIR